MGKGVLDIAFPFWDLNEQDASLLTCGKKNKQCKAFNLECSPQEYGFITCLLESMHLDSSPARQSLRIDNAATEVSLYGEWSRSNAEKCGNMLSTAPGKDSCS